MEPSHKSNELPREQRNYLVQGFACVAILDGTQCPSCGAHLSTTDFVRINGNGSAVICHVCHRSVFQMWPSDNPFAQRRT